MHPRRSGEAPWGAETRLFDCALAGAAVASGPLKGAITRVASQAAAL